MGSKGRTLGEVGASLQNGLRVALIGGGCQREENPWLPPTRSNKIPFQLMLISWAPFEVVTIQQLKLERYDTNFDVTRQFAH